MRDGPYAATVEEAILPTLSLQQSVNAQVLLCNAEGMFQISFIVILQKIIIHKQLWPEI